MPIIDVHAHWGKWPFPSKGDEWELLKRFLDRYEVAACLLSSSFAIRGDFVRGNAELAEILGRDERLFGYIVLNPNYPELCEQEMERYLRGGAKFLGAKFHPAYTGVPINAPQSREVLQTLRRYDVPILVHTYSAKEVHQVREVAEEFAQAKFIVAHMGAADWREAIRVARVQTNLYLETSCSLADVDRIAEAIKVLPHRVLFGSDLTLLHPAYTLGMIADAEISQAEREAILYRNALRVFRFPRPEG